MKLLGYLNLRGVLTCETGLLIGGTETFGIGGIDKQMIRESFRGKRPYIPGSSLKGKMRNLMERQHGLIQNGDSKVHSCNKADCQVCRVFGAAAEDAQTLTRLIVRDGRLITTEEDTPTHARVALKEFIESVQDYQQHAGGYTEVKTENVIKRTTGAADKPRHFERVPAGMKFAIDFSYRVFAETNKFRNGVLDPSGTPANVDMVYFREVIQALQLLTQDYLGASGSRGYGRVSFSHLRSALLDASSLAELWFQENLDMSSWKPWSDTKLVDEIRKLDNTMTDSQAPESSQETSTPITAAEAPAAAGVQ